MYCICSFVNKTNISQSDHQEDFSFFYFHEVDQIVSVKAVLKVIKTIYALLHIP